MLKRHLQVRYGMTPEQYRQKWKLPADYPMVAPNYASHRSSLAKQIGLGRKPGSSALEQANSKGKKPDLPADSLFERIILLIFSQLCTGLAGAAAKPQGGRY
jgi:hypothetical protein